MATGLKSLYRIKPPLQFDELDHTSQAKLVSHDPPLPSGSLLQGSCNGLICFSCDLERRVILVNPYIRRLKKSPPRKFVGCLKQDYVVYGFGYDDSTIDDYKVVRMELLRNFRYDVSVYRTSTNSWRKVNGSVVNNTMIERQGIFLNGAIHWMASEPRPHGIISFDVKDEEFRQVLLLPVNDDKIVGGKNLLKVIRECLGMVHLRGDGGVVVWVMKEYGRRESWTKQFVFTAPKLSRPLYFSMFGNHPILLKYWRRCFDANIAWYDMKTNKITNIDLKSICPPTACYTTTTYIESLVSP